MTQLRVVGPPSGSNRASLVLLYSHNFILSVKHSLRFQFHSSLLLTVITVTINVPHWGHTQQCPLQHVVIKTNITPQNADNKVQQKSNPPPP